MNKKNHGRSDNVEKKPDNGGVMERFGHEQFLFSFSFIF